MIRLTYQLSIAETMPGGGLEPADTRIFSLPPLGKTFVPVQQVQDGAHLGI